MGEAEDAKTISKILKESKTIAIVGLSPEPNRPSHGVAAYLKSKAGYKIIPVNPAVPEVLGEKSYPDLKAIPVKVDVVDIFRKPEVVPQIVGDAIKIKAKAVWMQEGIVHEEAAKMARNSGLLVAMDRCMMKEHAKLEKTRSKLKGD